MDRAEAQELFDRVNAENVEKRGVRAELDADIDGNDLILRGLQQKFPGIGPSEAWSTDHSDDEDEEAAITVALTEPGNATGTGLDLGPTGAAATTVRVVADAAGQVVNGKAAPAGARNAVQALITANPDEEFTSVQIRDLLMERGELATNVDPDHSVRHALRVLHRTGIVDRRQIDGRSFAYRLSNKEVVNNPS